MPWAQRAVPFSRLGAFRLSGFPVGRRPTEASWCAPAPPSVPTADDADAIVLATAVADVAAAVAAACGVDGRGSGLKIEATGRLGLRVDAGRRALLWCATVVLLLLLLTAGFTVTGRYGEELPVRGSGRTGHGLKAENSHDVNIGQILPHAYPYLSIIQCSGAGSLGYLIVRYDCYAPTVNTL